MEWAWHRNQITGTRSLIVNKCIQQVNFRAPVVVVPHYYYYGNSIPAFHTLSWVWTRATIWLQSYPGMQYTYYVEEESLTSSRSVVGSQRKSIYSPASRLISPSCCAPLPNLVYACQNGGCQIRVFGGLEVLSEGVVVLLQQESRERDHSANDDWRDGVMLRRLLSNNGVL